VRINALNGMTSGLISQPSLAVSNHDPVKSKSKKHFGTRVKHSYGFDKWGDVSLRIGYLVDSLARKNKKYHRSMHDSFKQTARQDINNSIRELQSHADIDKVIKNLAKTYNFTENGTGAYLRSLLKLANKLSSN
jgi:hypothetical protein